MWPWLLTISDYCPRSEPKREYGRLTRDTYIYLYTYIINGSHYRVFSWITRNGRCIKEKLTSISPEPEAKRNARDQKGENDNIKFRNKHHSSKNIQILGKYCSLIVWPEYYFWHQIWWTNILRWKRKNMSFWKDNW